MKKFKNIIAIGLVALVSFSCEEYLDKSPDLGLTPEKVFGDYYNFKGAVDRVNLLVHNYAHDRFDYGQEIGTYSDECQHVNASSTIVKRVNAGDWYGLNAPGFRWSMGNNNDGVGNNSSNSSEFEFRLSYREVPAEAAVGIRACNQILENAHFLTNFPEESEYTKEELRGQLIGQTYFLRGWFYFMLIRDFGGMPNMQRSFGVDEDFDQPRPTYQESSAWAVQDLDSAIMYLPESWQKTATRDEGRVDKTSARAVKEMILLYAASPNYNISREESLGFSGTPTYNTTMAKKALVANVEALNSAAAHYRYRFATNLTEYTNVFYRQGTNGVSPEGVFQPYISNASINLQGQQTGTAWYIPYFDGGWAGACVVPTQNAVDWYGTADGYELKDAAANGSTWNATTPYANRDPRLKNNIFCHGDQMLTVSATTNRGNLGKILQANQPNGKHYVYDTSNSLTFTGYYHAGKFRWPGCNLADKARGYVRTFSLIRYSQLYLDFAELANELYGPNVTVPEATGAVAGLTALGAIKKIRDRFNLPTPAMYYADKETFRDFIRAERARELFSEEHRWWDLKRWRIAHEVLANGVDGAYITAKSGGGFNYGKQKIGERVFTNRQYWYPFPPSTINMMANFEQNPGW